MFSHIMVGANNIQESKRFYDATLGALGVPPGFEDDKGRIFYMSPTGVFAITQPINGEEATAANGGTIGFAVHSPQQADAWHAAGLAAGGPARRDPGAAERLRGRRGELQADQQPLAGRI